MSRVGHIARHRAVMAAILTLCAGFALSACRTDPGVAAYVGSETLTEDRVDEVIKDSEDRIARMRDDKTLVEGTVAPNRDAVVTTFVLTEVCEKLRAEKPFDLVPVTAEQVVQADRAPLDSQFTKDRVAMRSCVSGVSFADVTPPTEAEVRDLYNRANAAGVVKGTFEEIKDQLIADPEIQQAIAISRTFTSMVEAGDVSVNPRYRPLELVIQDFGTGAPLVVVPIGEAGSDAVRDVAAE